MTKKDLFLLYKRETGNYPPDCQDECVSDDLEEYIIWLEDELMTSLFTVKRLESEIIILKANKQ